MSYSRQERIQIAQGALNITNTLHNYTTGEYNGLSLASVVNCLFVDYTAIGFAYLDSCHALISMAMHDYVAETTVYQDLVIAVLQTAYARNPHFNAT